MPIVSTAPGVASISKSGSSKLKGNVTFSEGSNITLTQVGNDISIASSGGSSTPLMTCATDFTNTSRYIEAVVNGGAVTYGTGGADLETSVNSGASAETSWNVLADTDAKLYAAGTIFSCFMRFNLVPSTTGQYFFGIGQPTVGATGITFTDDHVGFKVLVVAGVATLYATNAAGGVETVSAALTTVASNDSLDLIAEIVSTGSINYYWRKTGSALSSATNHTTNIPTAAENVVRFAVSNASTANNAKFQVGGACIQR